MLYIPNITANNNLYNITSNTNYIYKRQCNVYRRFRK